MTTENRKETRSNESRRFTRVYLTVYLFIFNKNKFEKLPEQREWDYEINLMEEVPKELNAKAYTMTVKEDKVLNQWLDKQLKAGLIMNWVHDIWHYISTF